MASKLSKSALFLIALTLIAADWPTRRGYRPYSDVGSFGRWIRISTFCEPSCSTASSFTGSSYSSASIATYKNGCHRYFVDDVNRTYFGYDLEVKPVPENGKFIVSVMPLNLASSESTRGLVPISLARYPEPQTLEEGDLYLLEVLVNRKTGEKIIDEIGVARTQEGL